MTSTTTPTTPASPAVGRAAPTVEGTSVDEPVPWLTSEQQQSWRAYLLGTARLNDALTRQLDAAVGLSMSEYEVLVRLSESPEQTLRMSELADSLVHSRSRLTHTVTRLERRGLVRRETCLADGRGVNCVMTPEGYALLVDAAPGHVRAVRAHLVDLLGEDEFRALGEAMTAIAAGPDGTGAGAGTL